MKILLAEDVGVTRRLLAVTLHDMGHEVIAVGDGAEAWTAFAQHRPELLLLDWLMPEMDGLEVCRRVRASERSRDTFVIMQTARDTTDDLLMAIEAGVDDYITKPVTREHLGARLLIAERRIALERARRALEESLEQARWLAGVGETLLTMQHELNSPLAALSGILALGLEAETPDDQQEALRDAAAQAERIVEIVRRMASLREPRSIERLPGVRMLAVPPAAPPIAPEG